MKKTKTQIKSKSNSFQVVEPILYLISGNSNYLSIGQSIRSTFVYDGKEYQSKEFDSTLFNWNCDRQSATAIPENQVEDVICWIHRHTNFMCDRGNRVRTVSMEDEP